MFGKREVVSDGAAIRRPCRLVAGHLSAVRVFRGGVTPEDDLRAALATVAAHLSPGGVALVAPDATADTFEETTEHGGGEDRSGRKAHYLMWTLPPDPGGTSFETHYAFLLREPNGSVRTAHDVHHEGLFGRATWLRLFGEVGLTATLAPRTIEGVEYDSFVARRDAS